MEHKNRLDEFIDDLNTQAKSGEFITYNWWPENHLKIQLGGKALFRTIADTPEEAYRGALMTLKTLIRKKLKEQVEESRVLWS